MWFWFSGARGVLAVGFLNLYLEGKYEKIRYTMYLGRQNFYLRVGIWLRRGMMRSFKGLENNQKLFSKSVFGLFCI